MSPTSRKVFIGLLVSAAFAVSCKTAATAFLDLPQQEEAEAPAPTAPPSARPSPAGVPQDTVRPPIESLFDPDKVLALLPRDAAGNVDWVAALRDSVIRPRTVLPGQAPASIAQFGFDFYFQGYETYFPHSTHVEWLACETCHSRIYRYRGEPTTMKDINGGESCGRCHGTVAFPTAACERCHTSLKLPEGRLKPSLLGDVTLARNDSLNPGSSAYPPASFPHWLHRIRYRCTACHPDLYDTRAGSARYTMADMSAGQGCGACHNSRDAFGLFECVSCHAPTGQESAGP